MSDLKAFIVERIRLLSEIIGKESDKRKVKEYKHQLKSSKKELKEFRRV